MHLFVARSSLHFACAYNTFTLLAKHGFSLRPNQLLSRLRSLSLSVGQYFILESNHCPRASLYYETHMWLPPFFAFLVVFCLLPLNLGLGRSGNTVCQSLLARTRVCVCVFSLSLSVVCQRAVEECVTPDPTTWVRRVRDPCFAQSFASNSFGLALAYSYSRWCANPIYGLNFLFVVSICVVFMYVGHVG